MNEYLDSELLDFAIEDVEKAVEILKKPTDSTKSEANIEFKPLMPVIVKGVLVDNSNNTNVAQGEKIRVKISGENMRPEMYFDIKMRHVESGEVREVSNYQSRIEETHTIPLDMKLGQWKIEGVRAHND